jgi:hypothetical protein
MKKIQRNQEKDKEGKQEEKKDENKNKPKREGKIKVTQGGPHQLRVLVNTCKNSKRENKEVPAGGERRKGN